MHRIPYNITFDFGILQEEHTRLKYEMYSTQYNRENVIQLILIYRRPPL